MRDIIKDRAIVPDDWEVLRLGEGETAEAVAIPEGRVIVPLAVWQARREFFSGNFPASTLVQVAALATPALKVEINAVAHIGAGHR